ncbi:hypothetical protein [Martelella mangrovi]|uniref:Uncharacterized protein n=1 Tax=Martelella mangrovi TaxID=1397477 RepID=A0ABV2I6Y2_9HYPH
MTNQTDGNKDFTRFLPATAPLPMPDQLIERPRHQGLIATILSPVSVLQRPRAVRFWSRG